MKKVFSLIVSLVLCILCYPAMIIESAVIEPKLVHTERWTTSYYIDDDTDTLYPYVQCVADIYSNGYVYMWMWNTHEWNGYDSIYNTVTLCQTEPYSTASLQYNLIQNGFYIDTDNDLRYEAVESVNVDISYYPSGYGQWHGSGFSGITNSTNKSFNYKITYPHREYTDTYYVSIISSRTALCKLNYQDTNYQPGGKSGKNNYSYVFTVDDSGVLTKSNTFRLYGHEFTITPEMLNNTVATIHDETGSVSEELEKYKALYEESESKRKALEADNEYKDKIINTLNETITALESQVEHLEKHCGDCDDDGRISISDSIILNRYLAGTVDSLPCSDPPTLAPEDGGSD